MFDLKSLPQHYYLLIDFLFLNSSRARLMDGLSVPVKETLGATGPQQVRWHLKLFNHFQSCPNTLYQAYNLKFCYQLRNYTWDECVEIHYIHFHCYMHRRHPLTCYEPGLHPQIPLRSNSTFSHKKGWEYREVILWEINWLFLMLHLSNTIRVSGLILPEVTIENYM